MLVSVRTLAFKYTFVAMKIVTKTKVVKMTRHCFVAIIPYTALSIVFKPGYETINTSPLVKKLIRSQGLQLFVKYLDNKRRVSSTFLHFNFFLVVDIGCTIVWLGKMFCFCNDSTYFSCVAKGGYNEYSSKLEHIFFFRWYWTFLP